MREIALHEAKNTLSALVAEVEATGVEIMITRHGRPAARIAPAKAAPGPEERAEILRRVIASRDAQAHTHPASAEPTSWEELKGWMEEDR